MRLVEPSRRGYERYYLAAALVVVLFALPFVTGILPLQVLFSSRGLSPTTTALAILYFALALVAVVAGALYMPRLAEDKSAESLPVKVLEADIRDRESAVSSRLRIRAGNEDFWVTVVNAFPEALHSALELAGQTDYVSVREE